MRWARVTNRLAPAGATIALVGGLGGLAAPVEGRGAARRPQRHPHARRLDVQWAAALVQWSPRIFTGVASGSPLGAGAVVYRVTFRPLGTGVEHIDWQGHLFGPFGSLVMRLSGTATTRGIEVLYRASGQITTGTGSYRRARGAISATGSGASRHGSFQATVHLTGAVRY